MLNRQLILSRPESVRPAFVDAFREVEAIVSIRRAVELSIREVFGRPTRKAQKFYFGNVLRQIAEQAIDKTGAGANPEQWHEFFKGELLPPRVFASADGGEVVLPPTTTNLNAIEFDAYVKRVQAYAATRFGVVFEDRFV